MSVANCPGLHSADEPWTPVEAEKLFGLSKEYGVPIDAAEFANEPNMMADTGFPKGFTPADYRRDQDLFFAWLKKIIRNVSVWDQALLAEIIFSSEKEAVTTVFLREKFLTQDQITLPYSFGIV